MMTNPENAPDGFALPAAVFALVVVGVLVTGGFYIARQESRIGVAQEHASRAFYLAERGVSEVMANPDAPMLGSMTMWGDTIVVGSTGEGTWEVDITRMATQTYFLDGTGTLTRGGAILGGANRRVGMVAKLFSANIDPPAALTTVGDLRIGGSSEIIGLDEVPLGWPDVCDVSALENKPGILIDDVRNIDTIGNKVFVAGNPAISEDPTITSEELLDFGGLKFDDLAALADIDFYYTETITNTRPDSTLVNGEAVCREGKYNWGDPLNPGAVCGNNFPVIYAHQSLDINSSSAGQGILLIEGDLKMQGGYQFFGPVIVKGTLSTAGTGGHVNGGVIAANVNLDTSTVLGNALVQFSSCSVSRALLNNNNLTRLRPLAQRSWVDLSNAGN